jgi:3'(2'), 5'-bisphosphate nucleotidase
MSREPMSETFPSAERDRIAVQLATIARAAGALILAKNPARASRRAKADATPVSDADLAAHDFIAEACRRDFPGMAFLSEEEAIHAAPAVMPEEFFIVDPLDGTREFLAGRLEYCVAIALVARSYPVAGALCAPAWPATWFAGASAWRLSGDGNPAQAAPIAVAHRRPGDPPRALVSRSHPDAQTDTILDRLGCSDRRAVGSAIKFGLIAEGAADLHLRCNPTMAWDSAAGQAVLEAAGGVVLDLSGRRLNYGRARADWTNAGIAAFGDPGFAEHAIAAMG